MYKKGMVYKYTYIHSSVIKIWNFAICNNKDGFRGASLVALEKAMAPHSSTLAWKTPWTEEPGRLQSMGSLRVGHDWATSLSPFTFIHWRRKWQLTLVFLPGESWGQWSLLGAVYGVTQSRTRLTWLSSSVLQGKKCIYFFYLFFPF